MIASDGSAMICDFGCSRMEVASLTMAQVTTSDKGTNLFWAPELIDINNRKKHSKETDVWAFGMTTYVSIFLSISVVPHRS